MHWSSKLRYLIDFKILLSQIIIITTILLLLIIIMLLSTAQYHNFDKSTSTLMLDNFQNISNYSQYLQSNECINVYSFFSIVSNALYHLLMFGYSPNPFCPRKILLVT